MHAKEFVRRCLFTNVHVHVRVHIGVSRWVRSCQSDHARIFRLVNAYSLAYLRMVYAGNARICECVVYVGIFLCLCVRSSASRIYTCTFLQAASPLRQCPVK